MLDVTFRIMKSYAIVYVFIFLIIVFLQLQCKLLSEIWIYALPFFLSRQLIEDAVLLFCRHVLS